MKAVGDLKKLGAC